MVLTDHEMEAHKLKFTPNFIISPMGMLQNGQLLNFVPIITKCVNARLRFTWSFMNPHNNPI